MKTNGIQDGDGVSLIKQELSEKGGKKALLQLLERGKFKVPKMFPPEDNLPAGNYLVRSSSPMEDSHTQTSAGKFKTLKRVREYDVIRAVESVMQEYQNGHVVISPDLTDQMRFSGVIYTNLNGKTLISMGPANAVHSIVDGQEAKTEVSILDGKLSVRGRRIPREFVKKLVRLVDRTDKLFGIPMDLEFALLKGGRELTLLQARPLPNPTDSALKEQEKRNLTKNLFPQVRKFGIKDIILGVGNYREILGDSNATNLSASTFSDIFTGNGKGKLGAVQLGRNELGYNVGNEVSPGYVMVGGKLFYNFAGDALQFRPMGLARKDLVSVINEQYTPAVMENPNLLNYSELQLYIQFPEQAKKSGLNPEPFKKLSERVNESIGCIRIPGSPPKKKVVRVYDSPRECLIDINKNLNKIRRGSAKRYVKAARMAFFAMEELRNTLERMQSENPAEFKDLSCVFQLDDPAKLRDALAYDESIGSFEVPRDDEYRYQGSFELTLPRSFPPERSFKKGKKIPNNAISGLVTKLRRSLEHREKVKFFLMRDYDYLGQLYNQFGKLSGFGSDIYNLNVDELGLAIEEPFLASYRINFRKSLRGKDLFDEPLVESDLKTGIHRVFEGQPALIFGSLSGRLDVKMGKNAYLIASVDQTTTIPQDARMLFVPENIRPGSHLFTLLSDYGIPVVSLPKNYIGVLDNPDLRIGYEKGEVKIEKI